MRDTPFICEVLIVEMPIWEALNDRKLWKKVQQQKATVYYRMPYGPVRVLSIFEHRGCYELAIAGTDPLFVDLDETVEVETVEPVQRKPSKAKGKPRLDLAGRDLRGKARREAIYAFLAVYIQKHGFAPTLDEITEGVGLASKSSVVSHLNVMEDEGAIRRLPGASRAIVLLRTEAVAP